MTPEVEKVQPITTTTTTTARVKQFNVKGREIPQQKETEEGDETMKEGVLIVYEATGQVKRPITCTKVILTKEEDIWKSACDKEMVLMTKLDVYELVDKPINRKFIETKWVFKAKENESGVVIKFK